MHSSTGQTEALAPEPADPPHPSHNCCYTTALGSGARHKAPFLVSVFGPSTSSCCGAEAQAPWEGPLGLSDPYLLSTLFQSPGPGPPGLCRSLLAPEDTTHPFKGNTANLFISSILRRSHPVGLTSPLLLSGWTK